MPSLYEVFERGTGRTLGRGSWQEVSQARMDAARAGVAADIRRASPASHAERQAMYAAARNPTLGRIVGGK